MNDDDVVNGRRRPRGHLNELVPNALLEDDDAEPTLAGVPDARELRSHDKDVARFAGFSDA